MNNEEKVEVEDIQEDAQQQDEMEEATGEPREEVNELLEDARSKADEHWNQCLRLQAEIENLRKRNERDLVNAHKFALEKFAAELLPVKDSLEMGINAADEEGIDVARLKEGGELTLKMLANAFDKQNIKEINPLNDKFNPDYHEAMSMVERDDVPPNTVVTVIQKGYLLNERLIRPAMVMVSKQAAAPAQGSIDEQA